MLTKDTTYHNKMNEEQANFHTRQATNLIRLANEYRSDIWIERNGRRVNAKSLLGLLSLGIAGGTDIRIIADGADEQEAVESLVELVENGFSDEN